MNARVKIRSSAAVQFDIDALVAERQVAEARIIELDKGWDAVLLDGDDEKAERHQAERAKQDRTIARVGLKLPPLEAELAAAKDYEDAQSKEAQRAAALELVDTIVSDASVAAYYAAAETIKAFLEKWQDAFQAAHEAGVPTPDERLRTKPGGREPDREETYVAYIDEFGNETTTPYAAMQFTTEDDRGIRYDAHGLPIPMRRKVTRTRTVKGESLPSNSLPYLPHLVNLPGVRFGEPSVWNAAALAPKEPKREIRLF